MKTEDLKGIVKARRNNRELGYKNVEFLLGEIEELPLPDNTADVVIKGNLPEKLHKDAEMYVGCVAGALEKETYLNVICNSGLVNVTVQKEKQIAIPDKTLLNYFGQEELEDYKKSGNGIFSITVYAEKKDKNS